MGVLDGQTVRLRERGECPLKSAPCLEEACAWWMSYENAEGHTILGCAVLFIPMLTRQVVIEQQRGQASTDKVATEIHGLGERTVLAAAALTRARQGAIRE